MTRDAKYCNQHGKGLDLGGTIWEELTTLGASSTGRLSKRIQQIRSLFDPAGTDEPE